VNGDAKGVSRDDHGWSDPLAAAGDRIQLVVEGANRVAAEVRAEAEAQARRYVEDAKRRAEDLTSERIRFIAETSDALLEQGRMVKAQSDELVTALQQAALQISTAASELASSRAPEPIPETQDPRPPAEPSAPQPREWSPPIENDPSGIAAAPPVADSRGDSDVSQGPRLLATKMAVAGSSRRQVEARLREIGVEDPVGLVDAAFGDV
jgi:hypothetical protein